MISQWWSWGLAAVGLLGLYLAGKKNKAGWLIGAGAQFLWIGYALVSEQYGFIATAIVYGFMYSKNYISWHREEVKKNESSSRTDV